MAVSRWSPVVLVLSLLLNVAVLAVAGVYVANNGLSTLTQRLGLTDPSRSQFVELARERFGNLPGAAVAFVGDSHVQNAPLSELVGQVASRGIGGQTVDDTAAWLDAVLDDPELERLVVWAGSNDILRGKPAEQTGEDMQALLAAVEDARPEVEVALLSVPPLRDSAEDVAAMNDVLREAAEDSGAEWLDVTGDLSADGLMDSDGIHLTPSGYVAIAPALRRAAG